MSDHKEIFTQFFPDPEVIFSSDTMFINTSTKEFTLVSNSIQSYDIAFERTYFTTRWLPIFTNILIIYTFKNKTYSILICQSFPFMLI